MTIKDIARLSGCSVATVSRVLNEYPDVSETTRRRVMAVVEEQGFAPNANARRLKIQNSRAIAVVVKGIQNMLFAGMVECLQQRAGNSGLDLAMYYLDEDADEVAFARRICRENKPPAVLFLGGDLEHFSKGFAPIAVPCVLITNTAADLGFANLASVTTDDTLAACRAADHLIGQGHRDIGILGGNWSAPTQISASRLAGCRSSFESNGIPLSDSRCQPCRFSMEDAYDAAGLLLERCPEITAIFAMSDVMALGAIRAILDMGRRVPEDVSVVGYDGLIQSRFTVPRLTTIRQNTAAMAELAMDLLHELMDGKTARHITVPFTLQEGESVCPPEGKA